MDRSIHTINADLSVSDFGARGRGIVWAVVGTGVEAKHPHFAQHENLTLPAGLSHLDLADGPTLAWGDLRRDRDERLDELFAERRVDIPTDPDGYGTSLAAVVAGESTVDEDRRLRGVAPECTILSVRAIERSAPDAELRLLTALRAIQWLNEGRPQRIQGVLLAVEVEWDASNFACGYTPVCVEVDRLVNAGVVVVAAAGNRGFDATSRLASEVSISDPGNAPGAITVGSTHRDRPREYGPSYFSARGPTADGRPKPDLLAPGEKITVPVAGAWAAAGASTRRLDGTAYASAHVAGAAAALLSVHPELVGRPADVKRLLVESAVDLGREPMYQGAGLLDLVGALQLARGRRPGDAAERRPATLKVFCSYSHKDRTLWQEFETHLSPMKRSGLIEVWSDREIDAGAEWEPEVFENLEAADLVVLLVSSYFIASDYCYTKELGRALERRRGGEATVVPVLARPVELDGTPIEKLQILPSKDEPITSFADPHKGWAEVAGKLRELVMKVRRAD